MTSGDFDNAIFAALPPAVRATLREEAKPRRFGQGEVFYEPGARVEEVLFPTDGILSVMIVMQDGAAVETATIGREGVVGLSAGLLPLRSQTRVIGQAPGAVAGVAAETVRRLAADWPQVRELAVRSAEAALAQAQQSVACNTRHDVEARFCRWLLACDDRVLGPQVLLTQEFLAIMLGVQRTTVSQVASGLQAAGLIRYSRGRIDILDRPALERRACECYAAVRRMTRRLLPASDAALTSTGGKPGQPTVAA